MTANAKVTELHELIGRIGSMYLRDDCTVKVEVIDIKTAWGTVRCLIKPLAGEGEAWVTDTSVTLDD